MVLPSPVGESVAANLITPLPRCVPIIWRMRGAAAVYG